MLFLLALIALQAACAVAAENCLPNDGTTKRCSSAKYFYSLVSIDEMCGDCWNDDCDSATRKEMCNKISGDASLTKCCYMALVLTTSAASQFETKAVPWRTGWGSRASPYFYPIRYSNYTKIQRVWEKSPEKEECGTLLVEIRNFYSRNRYSGPNDYNAYKLPLDFPPGCKKGGQESEFFKMYTHTIDLRNDKTSTTEMKKGLRIRILAQGIKMYGPANRQNAKTHPKLAGKTREQQNNLAKSKVTEILKRSDSDSPYIQNDAFYAKMSSNLVLNAPAPPPAGSAAPACESSSRSSSSSDECSYGATCCPACPAGHRCEKDILKRHCCYAE